MGHDSSRLPGSEIDRLPALVADAVNATLVLS
jgi:hypothetical protein